MNGRLYAYMGTGQAGIFGRERQIERKEGKVVSLSFLPASPGSACMCGGVACQACAALKPVPKPVPCPTKGIKRKINECLKCQIKCSPCPILGRKAKRQKSHKA